MRGALSVVSCSNFYDLRLTGVGEYLASKKALKACDFVITISNTSTLGSFPFQEYAGNC